VGVIDETSFAKKGNKTACVQRQHCGAVGKIENCVVSVHLGYATPDFYTLLDGQLYLPKETWHEDRKRCEQAGVPEDIVYRPKWQIALEQYQRAIENGLRFAWLTFDEHYGRNGTTWLKFRWILWPGHNGLMCFTVNTIRTKGRDEKNSILV
jgi:SRSO17 transposase